MAFLSNYPFLDQLEFRLMCEAFVASFEERDAEQKDWRGVQRNTGGDDSFIRIVKSLPAPDLDKPSPEMLDNEDDLHAAHDEAFEEIDEEALLRQINNGSQRDAFEVEYQILLSPSYSVPVLYFSIRGSTGQLVTDIEQVYALIVPEVSRSQIRDVGIMGGLSMTNHPITNIPAFFIHPCQTADALREVAGGRDVSLWEYLLLWIGIVGGSVGLNAPLFMGVQQT